MARLKLRAADADDLAILSAHVQDALVPLADMAWLREERRFVLALNRFRWEAVAETRDGAPLHARTHSLLSIAAVRAVRRRGLDGVDPHAPLNLLGITGEGDAIDLTFAGGGIVRIEADGIALFLEDVGEDWPTRSRPSHALD